MDTGKENGDKQSKPSGLPVAGNTTVGTSNVPRRLYFPPLRSTPRPKQVPAKPVQESTFALPKKSVGSLWIVSKSGELEKCKYKEGSYWCPNCSDWKSDAPMQFSKNYRVEIRCRDCRHMIDYFRQPVKSSVTPGEDHG